MKRHVVISYDVSNTKNRNNLFEFLKSYGVPVLKSVFEAKLTMEEVYEIYLYIPRLINLKTDSVKIYVPTTANFKKILCIGKIVNAPSYKILF